jgi:hypothetical protein
MQQPPSVPPRLPPQVSVSDQLEFSEEDRDWKPFAIAAIAVILLAILLIAVLFSLRNLKGAGGGAAGSGSGNRDGTEYSVGNSGKDGDTVTDSESGDDGLAKAGMGEAGESQAKQDSPSTEPSGEKHGTEQGVTASNEGKENSEGDDKSKPSDSDVAASGAKEQPIETVVLPIRIAQPEPNAASQDAGVDLQTSGGANPLAEAAGSGNVIFIIDFSGSMTGTRLERVKRSLLDAMDHFDEEQKFTVYFFDDGVYFPPTGPSMISANKKNKNQMTVWISQAGGGGGTNPEQALFTALDQKPDRIVVLSDGDFNPFIVESVSQKNNASRSPIRIDCVGLTESILTLQELARRNGKGIYYQAR